MNGHTPGPWHVGPMSKTIRPDVTTPHIGQINGGCIIAELFGADKSHNARLIAAAPTMYAYIEKCAAQGNAEARSILGDIHANA